MSGKKKALMVLIVVLLFGAVAAGIVWHMTHYIMIDFKFYPKDAQVLDLRGQEITVRHYEKILRRLPGCEVEWDVPLSGGRYGEHTKDLTITGLTDSDVVVLDYLTELETVRAEGCTDYAQLLALQERRPEVEVRYTVALGEESYSNSVSRVDLKNITAEEIPLLRCLSGLKTIICSGGDGDVIAQLREYCHDNGLKFGVNVGGRAVMETATSVSAEGVTNEELVLLQYLTDLEELSLQEPEAAAENLIRLREERADVDIRWEKEICEVLCSTEDVEIDLSGAVIDTLDQIEAGMAYFPEAEKVFLGECGMDNELLADFREKMREDYKVVWTVECGKKMKARTDDTTFMPTREHVYYFNDEEAYNLRYCEDMVCIDIGHMSISNVDFLEFMPDLEYLILAHTQVQHIEPIQNCKKLKFLELDWSPIKDLSPLVECTALEDLNLGNTYADFEPIGTMTWLNNLWMIGCSSGAKYRMTQALPDTKVMISGSATVANGWRNLDTYYDMRDLLGMEYMSW